MKSFMFSVIMLVATLPSLAADNLKLNPKLDYDSDSQDGPLITGDDMQSGFVPGKPAYVIMYGEGCFNSKRQARRTVDLYQKYSGRVRFIVIDIDHKLSPAQKELKKNFFRERIPHVMVLGPTGSPLYNRPGEVDGAVISGLLDQALQ